MRAPVTYQQYNLKFDELNNRLTKVKKEFGMRRAISSRSLTGETVSIQYILQVIELYIGRLCRAAVTVYYSL